MSVTLTHVHLSCYRSLITSQIPDPIIFKINNEMKKISIALDTRERLSSDVAAALSRKMYNSDEEIKES